MKILAEDNIKTNQYIFSKLLRINLKMLLISIFCSSRTLPRLNKDFPTYSSDTDVPMLKSDFLFLLAAVLSC